MRIRVCRQRGEKGGGCGVLCECRMVEGLDKHTCAQRWGPNVRSIVNTCPPHTPPDPAPNLPRFPRPMP
eukprot:219733-Chlamydomonas_euryale.AAC.3